MDMPSRIAASTFLTTLCGTTLALAQAPVAPAAATAATPPAPATKVESFRPAAGTLVTIGYNELGTIGYNVSVDARELSDVRGAKVRGVVVTVIQSQYRTETAMIDADELPELIRGVDALLAVKSNPTRYENFEVRYTTKGELELTAYNSGNAISYTVQAGRVSAASVAVDEDGLRKLRAMFDAANQLFAAQPGAGAKRP
jgi:hypothetical protein